MPVNSMNVQGYQHTAQDRQAYREGTKRGTHPNVRRYYFSTWVGARDIKTDPKMGNLLARSPVFAAISESVPAPPPTPAFAR